MTLYFVSGHQMRSHGECRANQHVQPGVLRLKLWVGDEYHADDHEISTPQLMYPAAPQWLQRSL